jgi:hypothetical protein
MESRWHDLILLGVCIGAGVYGIVNVLVHMHALE